MPLDPVSLSAALGAASNVLPRPGNNYSAANGRSDAYQAGVMVNPPIVFGSDFNIAGGGAGGAAVEGQNGSAALGGSIYGANNGVSLPSSIDPKFVIIGVLAVGAILLFKRKKGA
jgi:hypothetical protein